MSIYDYDEEDVRRTLFEEAKEMAKEELKETVIEELKREAKEELTQEVFAEGEQSGEQLKIVNQVIKKVKKSKTLETIASELEEEVADIKPIYDVVIAAAPDYNIDIIKNKLAIN